MKIAGALVVTLVSACALNVGYLIEHSVASRLPPLSLRYPLRSARLLLRERRWLLGFGFEACGWLLYVVALALAPLSLVQATAAGGVGILAVMMARYRRVPLTRLERLGVALSVTGLVLLGISLVGAHGEGSNGSYLAVGVWLGASLGAAFAATRLLPPLVGGGPAYGIATGILFAAGDVSTKAAVGGGGRLAFVVGLIGCYALGTMLLQSGFQRGNPLTTAGIATLFTNALPIVAGETIFAEPRPGGWLGIVRVLSFGLVVAGAVALSRHQHGAAAAVPEAATEPSSAAGSPRPAERRRRFSRPPLRWRVFAINAALLAAATLLLALTPVTIHAPLALVEALDLAIALVVMLAANFFLLRHTIAPIDRLVERMRTVDLLRPGQRLVERGGIEVEELVRAFNQMLERLETERRESGRRALQAQEAERRRIASGLHDEVGQVLTGVLLQLDDEETKQAVRHALEEVRRIARELRPEMLEQLGLVSALTELSRRFADSSGIHVERRLSPVLPPLSDEAELAVYRVAQESLTNVARHAGATRVELALEPGAGSVVLSVTDDGRGMTDAAAANGYGGLRGMRERALLVGGALAINRSRAGGVEVRLEVPAQQD